MWYFCLSKVYEKEVKLEIRSLYKTVYRLIHIHLHLWLLLTCPLHFGCNFHVLNTLLIRTFSVEQLFKGTFSELVLLHWIFVFLLYNINKCTFYNIPKLKWCYSIALAVIESGANGDAMLENKKYVRVELYTT